MRDRHRYRPGGWDPLERRLALTHGGPLNPALIGTLSADPKASGRAGRVIAQSDDAFDRFTRDYLQAQGAYLSSGVPPDSLKSFTTQRTNLLAQELTRIFSRLPGSFEPIKSASQRGASGNSAVVFQAFLYNKINGSPRTNPPPNLLQTLNSGAVLPPTGTSGAGATLYTLSATNAIESARIATINAAKFIANGTFKNS